MSEVDELQAHVATLKAEVRAQAEKIVILKREVTIQREALERRNLTLRAMQALPYVTCDGGCAGGVPDPDAITEEVVVEAERCVRRLRQWWENRKYRQGVQEGRG